MGTLKPNNGSNVFVQLRGIIGGIIGEDAAEILDIQPSSRFVDDLGMDSIKIVVLIEQGNVLYKGQIDFAAWVRDMPLRAMAELTVGDLIDFIQESQKDLALSGKLR